MLHPKYWNLLPYSFTSKKNITCKSLDVVSFTDLIKITQIDRWESKIQLNMIKHYKTVMVWITFTYNSIFLGIAYVSFVDNRRVNKTVVISVTVCMEVCYHFQKWFAKFWTIIVFAYIHFSLKEKLQFIQRCWGDHLKVWRWLYW